MTYNKLYERGADALEKTIQNLITEILAPKPRLTLSQWADKYAYLNKETSKDAGKFRAFAYQNGIMDAANDPNIEKITVIKSARVGYTMILDHMLAYYIHYDPCPMLVVQPTIDDAKEYSRKNIAPMLRNTPVLEALVGEEKDKDPDQRLVGRSFANSASIKFVGANSANAFRRVTVRIIAFDEVDSYPHGVDAEGDQIELGTKRTITFNNRKIILGSTPTIKGVSRIEKSWLKSDQRRYYVPCPQCNHKQVLKWSNLHWDKETDEAGKTIKHKPETAYFVCEESGCIIEENNKHWMLEHGEWISENPSEKINKKHVGFHIWAAYSLFENASWSTLAAEFLEVRHDPSQLQVFVNTVLGESWEEQGETVETHALAHRGERYDGETLPNRVRMITAGIDVQDNRLEMQLVGWGVKEESWVIGVKALHGDPAGADIWEALDHLLDSKFYREDGRALKVRAACIDTGGHHGERVYAFCRARHACNVYAIKGQAGARPVWPGKTSRGGVKGSEKLYVIGVDTAKDAIYSRLRISEPGPGYIHFPAGELPADYFEQLTAEKVQTRYMKGKPHRVWVLPSGKRNEALDMFGYALAAVKATGIRLDKLMEEGDSSDTQEPRRPPVIAPIARAPLPAPSPIQEQAPPRRKPGWMPQGSAPRRGWLK